MLAHLGAARPLGSAWLFFHLLLWTLETPLASSKGKLCKSWPADLDNLEQRQCPAAYPPNTTTTDAPQIGLTTPVPTPTPSPRGLRHVEIAAVFIVGLVFFVLISCGLSCVITYVRRRCCRSWEPCNENQCNMPLRNIHLPNIHLTSLLTRPPPYCESPPPYDDPPPYSSEDCNAHRPSSPTSNAPSVAGSDHVDAGDQPPCGAEDPHGPMVSSPTSNVPTVAESDHENAGYQDDVAQPSSTDASDIAVDVEGPSLACDSRSVPSPNNADEPCGAKPRPSDPSSNDVCALDCDDLLPYSAEDPHNSQVSPVDLDDAPPRSSASLRPEDPPPDSVSVSLELQCLLPALGDSPGEQVQPATPGAAEGEKITIMPPNLWI